MKAVIFFALITLFLLIGCTVGFLGGSEGDTLVIVPSLPIVVEIDTDEPYYYQDGYYYNYRGSVWFYSDSRQGPWRRLPRSRYPREVRYRERGEHRDHDEHRDNDEHHDNDDDHGRRNR